MTSREVTCQPPPPCPPPPALVSPGQVCSCGLTETCQEGQLCHPDTACTSPLCTDLQVEADSVEVRELLIIDKANTHGAILGLSCRDEAAVFNVGSGLTRIQARCNRR